MMFPFLLSQIISNFNILLPNINIYEKSLQYKFYVDDILFKYANLRLF